MWSEHLEEIPKLNVQGQRRGPLQEEGGILGPSPTSPNTQGVRALLAANGS